MLTLKPTDFRAAHKYQVDFDHPYKKTTSIDPHTKIKSFSIHTQKPTIFRPPRENQAISDLYTEVKSISIPTIYSNQLWCRNTKNS